MPNETAMSASMAPVSELIARTIQGILTTICAARDVLIERDSFSELATCLHRISPILNHLAGTASARGDGGSEILTAAVSILSREVDAARSLAADCSRQNRVYLLVNCRRIVNRLESTTREIARALTLLPLASLGLSDSITAEIESLSAEMAEVQFRAAVAEEEILDKIESGIRERSSNSAYANSLLFLIADAVGIPKDRSALRKELEEFRNEVAEVKLRKNHAEAIQMDQIIAMLSKADTTMSFEEKGEMYYNRRNTLGSQQLEPLQSFCCPITRDIMEDPVETSSGQVFERSAIEKWFTDGNAICPLTTVPLDTAILRPNITLRKSIEEWKERNTMITISSLKNKIESGDEQEVLNSLGQVQELCEERDSHREWVVLENYLPVLIGLLSGVNLQIRNRSLSVLYILVKDSDEVKERVADVDNAIESIVRSLGRRTEERKLSVALLLELSKNDRIRGHIGKVQGSILLLLTISNGDNNQAANDATELLERLSSLDENVVQMARANYFKPLLQRLGSGTDEVKKILLSTLAEMELTDHSKGTIFRDGALVPLLDLLSHGDIYLKTMAVKTLQNLSSLRQNGLQMIREGAVRPLLDLLQHLNISLSPKLREQVAATIMNIAISMTALEPSETLVFLDSEDDISQLFSLINLTGPSIQRSILQSFHALCQPPSAEEMRAKLRQCSAIQVLLQHCKDNDLPVRANSIKLLSCLIDDSEDSMSAEHLDRACLDTFLMIIQTSSDQEEITAAMGIISNLPTSNPEIAQWLMDAEALPTIIRFLSDARQNGSTKKQLTENAAGALRHFTISTNPVCQKRTAEAGVIPLLIQLLGSGTSVTKQHAAVSLAQFSENSFGLSKPIGRRGGFLCCAPPPEKGCPVHRGICSVESSFCLLEADALGPLVRLLGESDPKVCEAGLMALSTLIEGQRLQSGSKVLAESNGIGPIVRLLSSQSTELQEKSLRVLERIFQLEEYKQVYGASAQMPLVDLTQRGNGTIRALAARTLAHLNVLHEQSSYF